MVPAALNTGSDLPYCLPPTYRLCLSLSIPTPLICNTKQIQPLFYFSFYNSVSLTPFIVFGRLTYPVNLAYSQPLKSFLEGNKEEASVLSRGPTKPQNGLLQSSAI